MKKIITFIVVTLSFVTIGFSQGNLAFLSLRIKAPATIESIDVRDIWFNVGDYTFTKDDEWLVYKLKSNEEYYTNIYVCDVDTQKEADKLIKYFSNKNGCNSNITYTVKKKYNGYSYYVGIKITFKDAKKRHLEYQNKKIESINW